VHTTLWERGVIGGHTRKEKTQLRRIARLQETRRSHGRAAIALIVFVFRVRARGNKKIFVRVTITSTSHEHGLFPIHLFNEIAQARLDVEFRLIAQISPRP
jgi:hypothetical protein